MVGKNRSCLHKAFCPLVASASASWFGYGSEKSTFLPACASSLPENTTPLVNTVSHNRSGSMSNNSTQFLKQQYRKIRGAAARSGFGYVAKRLLDEGLNRLSGMCARRDGGKLPLSGDERTEAIIILSNLDWKFRFQRPQQMACALHRAGCFVCYVQPGVSGARYAGWRLQSGNEHPARLCLYSTGYGSLDALWRNTSMASEAARSLACLSAQLRARGLQPYFIVQHPLWANVVSQLHGEKIFYDCMDDHADFDNASPETRKAESALASVSDGIIASSSPLLQKWESEGKQTQLVRNGCEYAYFADARADCPTHMKKIIGYHGAIDAWFDIKAVRALADAFPHHTIVLVGGDAVGAKEALRSYKNVRLTGEVAYAEVARYVATFDVGLLPFTTRPLTHGTNPVKVYEYLAAGVPVAASPLPEMEAFGNSVTIVRDGDWINAVRGLLETPPNVAALQAFAANHTWEHRTEELLDFILNK